ncbi:aldehyde dehydrogenase family protein [Kordiimonas sp. SCSIO 12610]|uniref:aldehyde dehydrogenase family protein n=1 Tax=Kordiimonas sp. SCSIO 12610 TaxID=2829597 RepID=UPI00210B4BCC|nr:aldehyde dehydrogenase family protein [Kordiimonas sp. SCSIO 12610]UTW55778.1 aldehyde dehydrogenase family protein [Kordiimonas sp. SCSIO 12610]
MRILDKHYIGGAWVNPLGNDKRDIINPANAKKSGEMILGTDADVDAAVVAARRAFETFGFSSVSDRLELLQNIVAEYQARMTEMAEVITLEMGAPKAWAEGAHAPSGLGHLMTAIEVLKTYSFEEKLGQATVRKEPIGVVGMITPWNWPINQITCKVAPAIATGCTMVLKPSEVTPYSAQLFTEIMHKAGVPAGVYNVVYGEGPTVGETMSLHPDIDMISITGSGRAGAAVQANAAKTIKRVTQELGGKSANIVLDDADFEKVVARSAIGVMTNTGQTCTALSRMLVPNDKVELASEIAAKAVCTVVSGDPQDPATTMGPIAHEIQYKKVGHMIQEAVDEGATLVAGGADRPDTAPAEGFYVKPTVFSGVTPEMTIAKEEVFGPVLAIMGYEDEEDAIRIANDSPYGLSGAVQSGDPERARRVAAKLRTGMVLINGARNELMAPFGGYKQSGNGREWGPHAFADFLELKSVME